ncbi:MAG TPA: alkaline phosphatase family protein [Phototrophicaceae bacterium]|nr:alkaline phosphatase family protein [Phototrophicaceae bacterium]
MPLDYTLSSAADQLEAQIRANRLFDVNVSWQSELIFPHFGGLSIYNLTQTIASLFGAPASHSLDAAVQSLDFPTGGIDRVLLLITDGLGYQLLHRLVEEDPTLYDAISAITNGRGFVPLTSVSPSTTACALPTFWTAQPPAASGMVGTTYFMREFSVMGDLLQFSPALANDPPMQFEHWGLPPERFIPVASLAEQLMPFGVPTHLVLGYNLAGSGLSRLLHRGIHKTHLHSGGSDVWKRLGDVLTLTAGQRCCISAYLPNVDALSHLYGQDTPYVRGEIRQQMVGLQSVLESAAVRDGHTLVLVTADHGHVNTPRAIAFDQEPRLSPVLAAMRGHFGGDERFAYLYLREGTRADVRDIFAEHFGDVAILDTEKAVNAGLFGTGAQHPDLWSRLGDLILIPRAGTRLTNRGDIPAPVSIHAGMSDHEMLVPLLWKWL